MADSLVSGSQKMLLLAVFSVLFCNSSQIAPALNQTKSIVSLAYEADRLFGEEAVFQDVKYMYFMVSRQASAKIGTSNAVGHLC